MELYEELFGRGGDVLEELDFVMTQFKKSKLTLSSIQHKKVPPDIDMDFEELIGVLLSVRESMSCYEFDEKRREELDDEIEVIENRSI